MRDVNKYTTYINNFTVQYDALHGDITDASQSWSDCGASNCHGDDDEMTLNSPPATYNENYCTVRHLELAGFA